MRLFLIIICCAWPCSSPVLLGKLAFTSSAMQQNCAELFPKELEHRALAQSFVCGQRLEDPYLKDLFRKTSLLHLMVVSGSHLQLLSFFLLLPWPARLREQRPLKIFIWVSLLAYCLITGFQAPVVRAFISRIWMSFNQTFQWNWDFGKVQIAAGLSILFWIPEWISSLSFYLSWLASLGFLLTPLYKAYSRSTSKIPLAQNLLSCLAIQVLLVICFCQFSFWGVLTNALLGPVISLVLFPLSILALIFPFSIEWVDWGWSFLIQILDHLANLIGESGNLFYPQSQLRWIFLWTALAAAHCFFDSLRKYRYQNAAT